MLVVVEEGGAVHQMYAHLPPTSLHVLWYVQYIHFIFPFLHSISFSVAYYLITYKRSKNTFHSRAQVAGGGGGSVNCYNGRGGNGGGPVAASGSSNGGPGGGGGGPSSGGAGVSGGQGATDANGAPGAVGICLSRYTCGSAGGGGGYWGGGSQGGQGYTAGAGGGSSYCSPSAVVLRNQQGGRVGNGIISIAAASCAAGFILQNDACIALLSPSLQPSLSPLNSFPIGKQN